MAAQRIFTDRTRFLEYQVCPRKRYLAYHAGPNAKGLEPVRRSWHLVLGGAVHEGLAILLANASTVLAGYIVQATDASGQEWQIVSMEGLETWAVAVALAFYDRETTAGLDMGQQEAVTELAAADPGGASLTALLQESLLDDGFSAPYGNGTEMPAEQGFQRIAEFVGESQPDYTRRELRALTEAMVRAYARRRLPELLAEFDVLEVEREGEWKVAEIDETDSDRLQFDPATGQLKPVAELWFASRPDALLLHRATQTLHIMSFKTTGTWDARKGRDAERDVQGLSEGVEVERRLAASWNDLRRILQPEGATAGDGPVETFLRSLPAPPRIHAIRYEYLLKGTRKQEDRGPLQGKWTQRTPLLRGYYNAKTGEWAHSWTWMQEDELGTSVKKSLAWASWKGQPAWDETSMMDGTWRGVAHWIDALDRRVIQPGASDILADQFPAPITVYRNEDDLRDWLEQVEAQETRVARDVAEVRQKTITEQRSSLNILFPQSRRACSYPSDCQFVQVCFGSGEMKERPELSGEFRERVPNHPVEEESFGKA